MTATVVLDDEAGRQAAVEALRAGGLVAIPTDTVYGLAVDLATPTGIERLFQVKQRPPDRGIVLLLDEPAQMADLAVVTPVAEALAAACWPGGLTLVLEQRPDVPLPDVLTGGARTIGLRVPAHDAPRALARVLGPLPTTSANVSGRPELGDAAAILAALGDGLELILDAGPARGGVPSTVVDASGIAARILRPGAIDATRLEAVLAAAGLAGLAGVES